MRKIILVGLLALALPAHAGIISVSGPNSNLGTSASIIGAPADVSDDAATNTGQQGFNEQQGILLTSNLSVDGGSISSGTVVDSHMIFLNTQGGLEARHFNVVWEFTGTILGVMSDRNGVLESSSSALLGAPGTVYPGAFNARGLETSNLNNGLGNCNLNTQDCYSVSGNTLTLSMHVTEPGDWIRVITASPASVPEPAALLLLGAGLLGLAVRKRIS